MRIKARDGVCSSSEEWLHSRAAGSSDDLLVAEEVFQVGDLQVGGHQHND